MKIVPRTGLMTARSTLPALCERLPPQAAGTAISHSAFEVEIRQHSTNNLHTLRIQVWCRNVYKSRTFSKLKHR